MNIKVCPADIVVARKFREIRKNCFRGVHDGKCSFLKFRELIIAHANKAILHNLTLTSDIQVISHTALEYGIRRNLMKVECGAKVCIHSDDIICIWISSLEKDFLIVHYVGFDVIIFKT